MILFLDTETTGFYQDRLPYDHPDQPGLCQIAALLMNDDGSVVSQFSMIVNPDRPIPEKASAIHGITDEIAKSAGIAENSALGLFKFMSGRADLVVAHNAKFDISVMKCVCARNTGGTFELKTYCTMEAATPVVNLPPTEKMIAAGMNKPKAPKLEECIKHFFGEDLDGAHDALVDVNACARVFFHLIKLGHFQIPHKGAA